MSNQKNEQDGGVSGATHCLHPLPADELRWICDPETLPFETTEDVEPIVGVIGQEGAVDALRFGLETSAPGQNIFVRGLEGTGRMTLVRRLMEEIQPACPTARDHCYVHNFAHPDRPRLISLRRGRGKEFRRRIKELAAFISEDLPTALSSEPMRARWNTIERDAQKRIDAIVQPFELALREADLALVTIQAGQVTQSVLFPVVDGKPVPPEEFEQLRASGEISDEQFAAFRTKHEEFQLKLDEIMAQVAEIQNRATENLRSHRERAIRSILREPVKHIETDFAFESVQKFLTELVEYVATSGQLDEEDEEGPDHSRLLQVNVVISHAGEEHCPIVIEHTPTVTNLLGTIDHSFGPGESTHSDHTMIRAGSMLRADGGYLVLEARDVANEPEAWKVLVRALRTGKVEIAPPDISNPWVSSSLKPEPIDVNIKVILLGDDETYYILDSYDPDFPHLFKVLADFDTVISRDQGVVKYAEVLARIAKDEKLPPYDKTAVAALIEHGARIAARKGKVTTCFGRLADIAREAAFVAGKQDSQVVKDYHVRDAVYRSKRRADLPSRRFREFLADGTIRIDTSGREIGQINGLAVLQAGPLTYGFPARITGAIGPGRSGVINIEREASLSGSIHTKGFQILRGLLRHLLRTYHPLAFRASIAFEQSYGGIDGDSASGAEMCCLLSALTDIPLRQDIAMTGAIDQHGHILPIGAVNEKIEGFFDTCRDIGLTGTQGVIIPRADAGDLMLRHDLVDACGRGLFSIYAVETIHDAIEILTGMSSGGRGPNGGRDEDGRYAAGTVLGVAVERAFEYWVKATQTSKSLFDESGDDNGEAEDLDG